MNIALIKAGGVGSRMGAGIPKQFISVNGKPIIIHTLEAFEKHPSIDAIYVVCVEGWQKNLETYAQKYGITKLAGIATGGETSLKSIRNGLDAVREKYSDDDILLIHDANRPCVTEDIISDVLAECGKYGMAVAAVPCNDEVAVLSSPGGKSSDSFADHKMLCCIQTPDAYKLHIVSRIFDEATEEQMLRLGATNVLAIQQGYTMHFSMGASTNIRLTTMEDIMLMEALIKDKD